MSTDDSSRRAFLKQLAVFGGAAAAASRFAAGWEPALHAAPARAPQAPDFVRHVGLELFTVRNLMTTPSDYEATLAKLAAIGFKEVEPANGYAEMTPKAFRAMLDRYGLSMPSTHSGASGATLAEVEKVLEGFQTMGIEYTTISIGAGRGGGRRGAPPAGGRAMRGRGGPGRSGPGRGAPRPPESVEAVKQRCAQLNADGKIVQKFGMKILVHNHTAEFDLLDDGKTTTYDLYLSETDPSLVVMQLDIGWASVAGQDVVGLFKRAPGRFELWHVKDAWGLHEIDPKLQPSQRMREAMLVPVGLGEVDYKTIFANAETAGMKHYAIEQDNAAAWGDALAAARVSYENLTTKILA